MHESNLLTLKIFVGLVLGAAAGLFFGEKIQFLDPLGRAFIILLQLPVIPYMMCCIITGITQFSLDESRKVFRIGGKFALLLWGIIFLVCYSIVLSFPKINFPFLYASTHEASSETSSILEVFLLSNPFEAMAKGLIPAIAVFSILIGIALLRINNRQALIDNLMIVQDASLEITKWIAKLSPIGVFALIATFTGTVTPFELGAIKYYLASALLSILVLALWIFPALVTSLIPISYRDFVAPLRNALLLAISSGSTLVVLPLITDALRSTLDKIKEQSDAKRFATTIVPICQNFPLTNHVITVLFILFASWYYSIPLSPGQNIYLAAISIMNGFGDALTSIPFLLSEMHLPSDAFDLFVPTAVIATRVLRLLSVMGIASLSILMACSLHGLLVINWRKITFTFTLFIICLISSIFIIKHGLHPVEPDRNIFLKLEVSEKATVVSHGNNLERKQESITVDTLELIKKTGILRVGYNANSMPFAYFNQNNDLIGFDIAMAHKLARSLNARIAFIPFEYDDLSNNINHGTFDIAMSSITMNEPRLSTIGFSNSYLQDEIVFVTKDYKRKEYLNLLSVQKKNNISIAVLEGTSHEYLAIKLFPHARITKIKDFNNLSEHSDADALLWSYTEARSFALQHPAYIVVRPTPKIGNEIFAYAMNQNDLKFMQYINEWLTLQKESGFFDQQYRYFVLGNPDSLEQNRWSIGRNVFNLWD